MSDKAESPREFISTAQAAKQLGLSLGAVQQMVECGTLAGWKTAGGHRRIRQDSVDALLARARSPGLQPRAGSANSKVRVLVVEDDRLLQGIYRETFAAWDATPTGPLKEFPSSSQPAPEEEWGRLPSEDEPSSD